MNREEAREIVKCMTREDWNDIGYIVKDLRAPLIELPQIPLSTLIGNAAIIGILFCMFYAYGTVFNWNVHCNWSDPASAGMVILDILTIVCTVVLVRCYEGFFDWLKDVRYEIVELIDS